MAVPPPAPREARERVLPTLSQDGTRRWINPMLSRGRFLERRRALAWVLIAVFTVIPYLRMNGKPVILLDIVHRQFTLFGSTFLPTDTMLLMLLLVGIFLAIFLVTAVYGRVLLASAALGVFIWAVTSGQFDDLSTPGFRILHEDDPPAAAPRPKGAGGGGQPV